MRFDNQGWLQADPRDPKIERIPSVRSYPFTEPAPLGLVWHYTGGRGGYETDADSRALAQSIVTYTRGKDRAASWHLLVDKDGAIFQSVPILIGSWHVGKPGTIAGKYFSNINRATIGIELENAGRLTKVGDKFYTWPYFLRDPETQEARKDLGPDPKLEIDPSRAEMTSEGAFDSFPDAQVASAKLLAAALIERFKWTRPQCSYGHVQFAEGVKEDPGPIWMGRLLPALLDSLFGSV